MKSFLSLIYKLTPEPLTRVLLRGINATFNIGAAGVFFSDGEVLVLRHVYRHRYPWGLPSGFLKAGETAEAGALRELAEEIGAHAAVDGIVGMHLIRPRHLEVTVKGTIDRAQPLRLSHEIFEAAFFPPEALPDAMPPDQKQMVRLACGQTTLSRSPDRPIRR